MLELQDKSFLQNEISSFRHPVPSPLYRVSFRMFQGDWVMAESVSACGRHLENDRAWTPVMGAVGSDSHGKRAVFMGFRYKSVTDC